MENFAKVFCDTCCGRKDQKKKNIEEEEIK